MSTDRTFLESMRAYGLLKDPAPPRATAATAGELAAPVDAPRYLLKALADEVQRVYDATVGTRNHTLNRAAFSLGQLVAGAGLDRNLVIDELTAAAQTIGLDPTETRNTINSGLSAGSKEPRGVPALRAVAEVPAIRAFDPDTGEITDERSIPLRFASLREVAAEVDAAGDPTWLFAGLWPADAYGVLAAEDKAGKSWSAADAAISVASGTAWLATYECTDPGPVLLFFGEGGKRNLVRRMRAVAAARGLVADDLDIRVCERVPHLSSAEHLALVHAELTAHPARLVIIDPLYLAARGSSGSDLYAMGEALEGIQHVCQSVGAALIVVTHFNKTGEGRGAKRITGVGPAAWGRVVGTAHVEHKETDPDTKATDVILGWEFIGGEIADTSLHIRRRVWADDAEKLGSPLNYRLVVIPDDFKSPTMRPGVQPAAGRVWAVLEAADTPLTVSEIGDRLAEDGRPLKRRTIQNALSELGVDVYGEVVEANGTTVWRIRNRTEA